MAAELFGVRRCGSGGDALRRKEIDGLAVVSGMMYPDDISRELATLVDVCRSIDGVVANVVDVRGDFRSKQDFDVGGDFRSKQDFDVGVSIPTPIAPSIEEVQIAPKIPFIDEMSVFMHKYIDRIVNVVGDGNCGYLAVSALLGKGEDAHELVRHDLIEELVNHKDSYTRVFGDETKF
ncbi:uncharacterized protein LOC131633935 [Vicia villosa]|uniref:uncharacterized protein LOC131633935 n=1 Tax=Vicia villosa TaxID=3911 RepID=UPI00273CA6DE|nr:uncharacterized protein LOC131633935 [Vicia villosa]